MPSGVSAQDSPPSYPGPVSPPSMGPRSAPGLPVGMTAVLRQIPDVLFRDRLRNVLTATTNAINQQRVEELTRIEELISSDESSESSIADEIGPIIGTSVTGVNTLVAAIGRTFPKRDSDPDDEMVMKFGSAVETTKRHSTELAIHRAAQALVKELGRFGERVRMPSAVTDRWTLFIDLQEFRGRCRSIMQELAYAALAPFADVQRADVAPGYAADLDEALVCRYGWITLSRALGPINARLQMAGIELHRPLLLALNRELRHFCATHSYRLLRPNDKRTCIAFMRDLEATLKDQKFGEPAQALVQEFMEFLQTTAEVNQREILVEHDRETFAECARVLDQAEAALTVTDNEQAASLLRKAHAAALTLFGHDHTLDDYLMLRQRWPIDDLVPTALPFAVEELRECLAEAHLATVFDDAIDNLGKSEE